MSAPPRPKPETDPLATCLDLAQRPRRNRKAEWSRRLVREHVLSTDDLIWPIFLVEGESSASRSPPCPASSGCRSTSRGARPRKRRELGIPAIALFPIHRSGADATEAAREALNPKTSSAAPMRAIKTRVPQIGVICDVALDPYTSHGHDGILRGDEIVNDETVEVLVAQALVQARGRRRHHRARPT